MSQLELPNSDLVKAVAVLTNNHVMTIRKKPSFVRKIEKRLNTNRNEIPVPELQNDDDIKESSCPYLSFPLVLIQIRFI